MESHFYGMRLRPFSIGCQPMNDLVNVMPSIKYWNILEYSRKLTQAECYTYELEELGSNYQWNK